MACPSRRSQSIIKFAIREQTKIMPPYYIYDGQTSEPYGMLFLPSYPERQQNPLINDQWCLQKTGPHLSNITSEI